MTNGATNRLRIFVSSVQKEMAAPRRDVADFVRSNALLQRFFDVFLFEEPPAADRRPGEVYLAEVGRADIYLGLFGYEYGWEDADGVSPTEREFNEATRLGKTRLVYVAGSNDAARHPKMRALVGRAGEEVLRRRFGSSPELSSLVFASLVEELERRGRVVTRPFDAAACPGAGAEDLSEEKLQRFLRLARNKRDYPLQEETPLVDALAHLNLLDSGHPTRAAVLLFGREPQRFLSSSEIKCLHFHGTEVRKPIPSYQTPKGSVFELVDQAVDFVMSKLDRRVGTRALGPQAPVDYELPPDAVAEAIVNAVAHRDYASAASVQVMLFSDRLEVWNPGVLPQSLTIEQLWRPHSSVPRNLLIAEPMFLAGYIERAGTGTLDMIALCREAGLPPPQFRLDGDFFVQTLVRPPRSTSPVTGEVTVEVAGLTVAAAGEVVLPVDRLLGVLEGEKSRQELQKALNLRHEDHFREAYLQPALDAGLIEMTVPDKPTSRLQKYRRTAKGAAKHAQSKD